MEYDFDKEQLISDISKVLKYSQGFSDKVTFGGVPAIVDKWFENKKFFIDHMDGKLIYQLENPVSFELDENAKEQKFDNFISLVEEHYDNWQLANFLRFVGPDDFYNNKTTNEYTKSWGEKAIIPPNFKVVKAFKFFETDENVLKQLQSEASRIIQENIISGYLCFSVHPLDYLSVSENIHNWRSCHALDGDYRSGNLNYMVDKSTVVCYLKAEREAILPHFPEDVMWNSKKWRVLLFFSNDDTLMFAGRQYPFTADKGIDLIKRDILPKLRLGSWTEWTRTIIREYYDDECRKNFVFKPMMPIADTLKSFSDVVKDAPNSFQFDDLLRSTVYSPVWTYRKQSAAYPSTYTGCTDKNTSLVVGAECPCPVCGQDIIGYPSIPLCRNCAGKYSYDEAGEYEECQVCGSMAWYDDMYTLEFSELRVCAECYEKETVACQECFTRDMPYEVKYRKGTDNRCLCPYCWENSQIQHLQEEENKTPSHLFF